MKRTFVIAAAMVFAATQVAVATAATHRVSQKGRSFEVKQLSVAKGDIIHFANDDEFIHQVHVNSPTFSFDTAESPPGNGLDIEFTTPGTFEVRCHIHPKMLLKVTVE